MACFPLMVEVENKDVTVIGGGMVAYHKIKTLLPFGPVIRVISEYFCVELISLAKTQENRITLCKKKFEVSDIDDESCFVIAATDNGKVQTLVSELCRERRIPVHVVDEKEKSSFYFPAVLKKEELVISVSTGGNSPVAAGHIRNKIAENLPAYYGKLIDILGEYRGRALDEISLYCERKDFFKELLVYGEEHEGNLPLEVVEDILLKYEDK